MAQKSLLKIWLLWFLFSASTAFGASLSCVDLFAGKQRAVTKIDTFVSEQLRASGFQPAPRERTSLALRFRSARALSKIDFRLLADDSYRADQVEKLIDLQVSRSLSPVDDLALSPAALKSVRRLILRRALDRGLLSLADQRPSALASVRRVLFRILTRPEVRLLTQLKLPLKTVQLTDDQIWRLLSGPTSRILDDANFQSLVNAQGRVTVIRTLNRAAVALFGAVMFAITYQQIGAEYDKLHEQAVKKQTDEFKAQVNQAAAIDAGAVALSMAESEEQEVLQSFRAKFGTNPTPEELKEIRTKICVGRYGQILNATQTALCIGG